MMCHSGWYQNINTLHLHFSYSLLPQILSVSVHFILWPGDWLLNPYKVVSISKVVVETFLWCLQPVWCVWCSADKGFQQPDWADLVSSFHIQSGTLLLHDCAIFLQIYCKTHIIIIMNHNLLWIWFIYKTSEINDLKCPFFLQIHKYVHSQLMLIFASWTWSNNLIPA